MFRHQMGGFLPAANACAAGSQIQRDSGGYVPAHLPSGRRLKAKSKGRRE
jgi:hypothetical protein